MNELRRNLEDRPALSRAPNPHAPSAEDERRKAARRMAVKQRTAAPRTSVNPVSAFYLIAHLWWIMAPVMAVCLAMMCIAEAALPPLPSIISGIAAIAVAGASKWLVRFERDKAQGTSQRFAAMLLAVGLPMLLFGFAIAFWVADSVIADWSVAVGGLIVVATIASVVLTGRLPSIAAATLLLWLPLVIVATSLTAWMVLIVGTLISIAAVIRQLQNDRAALAQQRESERRQARAEEILHDYEQTGQGWFWESDRRGSITYISPTIGDLIGVSVAEICGRPFTDLFNLEATGQESERTLNFHLSARSSFSDLQVLAAGEGEERWWSISGRPVYDEYNNFHGFRGSGSDLTQKRRSEAHASRLAHYDSLTGLANRLQMSKTMEKVLGAVRPDHRACAVFLLDLDRFKQVNDTMGHPAGDALLKQVAQRLERTIGDAGRVGRLGGDEFQVVLPGQLARDDLGKLADQIIANLSQPYSIEGASVVIGVSIGIALAPDDGVTSEALIRNADLALYAAKDGGRGRHHFYASDLHSDAEERRQLEHDLREAINAGGLELHYQPVVQTTTEKITGFEALLRWTHPVLGPMSPAKFIPIAEEAGLIAPLGEWALRTACFALAQWPPSVRVAVNVSTLQFANPALPAIVTSALASAQVDPARLELEITESVFLNDDDGTDAMFAALKRVGVRLALDDFGTGYSSLGYLRKAPFDKIKIDQSFVRGATMPGSRNGAIIAAIVSLAEALGMETTAEGVETLDELDLVRSLGCSHVQGYIYAKPLTATAASSRLTAGLIAIAEGPRSARANRHTMLRKVLLEHAGESYKATIRNISQSGALIEGLWNVPPGTIFGVHLADGHVVTATARWCQEERMGVEFAQPLAVDETGRVRTAPPRQQSLGSESRMIRRMG